MQTQDAMKQRLRAFLLMKYSGFDYQDDERKNCKHITDFISSWITFRFIWFSIRDLTNKKDVHIVTIHEAYAVLELEHWINGLIPIGTDYYCFGIDDDASNAYLIKSSKKWLKEIFDFEIMPNRIYHEK